MKPLNESVIITPCHFACDKDAQKTSDSAALSVFLQACQIPENDFFIAWLTNDLAKKEAILITPAEFFASHNDVLLESYANSETLTKAQYDAYFKRLSAYFSDEGLALKKGRFPHFYLDSALIDVNPEILDNQLGRSIQSLFASPLWHKRFCDLQMLSAQDLPFNGLWLWARTLHARPVSFKALPTIFSDNIALVDFINTHEGEAKTLDDFTLRAHPKDTFLMYVEKAENVANLNIEMIRKKQKRLTIKAQNGEFTFKKKSFILF